MLRQRTTSSGLAVLLVLALPAMASAGLLTSLNTGFAVVPGTGLREWQGVATYMNSNVEVQVEYAVFQNGQFPFSVTPAIDPADYVYAFQVVSVTDRSNHPEYAYVGKLSLSCQGNELIRSIGYITDGLIPNDPNEKMPTLPAWGGITTDKKSVSWNYSSITVGLHSPIMYYGSIYIPELARSSISGYGTVQSGVMVPNPSTTIPEPATMCMLGLGGLGVLIRRRH